MPGDELHSQVSIIPAGPEHISGAATVLATAFEDEVSTNWILDLSTQKGRKRFAAVMAQSVWHFYARGDTVLVALEGARVVGVAVLNGLGPGRRVSGWPHLRATLAHLPALLGLSVHLRWRHLPAAGRAVQPASTVKRDYYTLEWLAVDPFYQRRGIGQMLLAALRERVRAAQQAKGIYAYTVGDANRAFYESCGYDLLSRVEAESAFVVYHMVQPAEDAAV